MGFTRPGPRSSRVVRPAEIITSQLVVLQAAAGERHPVTLEVRSAAGECSLTRTSSNGSYSTWS